MQLAAISFAVSACTAPPGLFHTRSPGTARSAMEGVRLWYRCLNVYVDPILGTAGMRVFLCNEETVKNAYKLARSKRRYPRNTRTLGNSLKP